MDPHKTNPMQSRTPYRRFTDPDPDVILPAFEKKLPIRHTWHALNRMTSAFSASKYKPL